MNLRYEVLKKRHSKIHLHDLILIMKCLYPYREVVNPYEEEIAKQNWGDREKELVSQLVYASCLLNQKYRRWNKYAALEAIEEDYINALSLAARELRVKKPSALLSCGSRRILIELWSNFGGNSFTAKEVRRLTRVSKSQIHRCLQELQSEGMLKHIGTAKNGSYVYELKEEVFWKQE